MFGGSGFPGYSYVCKGGPKLSWIQFCLVGPWHAFLATVMFGGAKLATLMFGGAKLAFLATVMFGGAKLATVMFGGAYSDWASASRNAASFSFPHVFRETLHPYSL